MVLIVILTLGLFIKNTSDKSRTEAVSKAKLKFRDNNYPSKPGRVKGIIYMGGPSPGIQIPGEFEVKVTEKNIGTYLVTFTEYWSSKDFSYAGAKEGIQSHYEIFEVKDNEVINMNRLFFSDKENGAKTPNTEDISINVFNGIMSVFDKFKIAMSSNFPNKCPDNDMIFGLNEDMFKNSLLAYIPRFTLN